MLLHIDTSGSDPLHERIAAGVRRAIAEGEAPPGSSLPPARELAGSIDVHVNTVLRAYRDLRDEGLIDLRRGRGATVTARSVDRSRILARIDELLAEAARQGLSRAEVSDLLVAR